MFCMRCQNDLSQCTCPDMNERLEAAAATGYFAYKKCTKCGKHYDLCKCENPQWAIQDGNLKRKQEN